MKHLDTLFRKMFGREKDTQVSFDEEALWDSIVEDLGPKNSIVPTSSKFGGWIPLSIVLGVILAGGIYLALNSIQSENTDALLTEDINTSINETIIDENTQQSDLQTDIDLSRKNTTVYSDENSVQKEQLSNQSNTISPATSIVIELAKESSRDGGPSRSIASKNNAENSNIQTISTSPEANVTQADNANISNAVSTKVYNEVQSSMTYSNKPVPSQVESNSSKTASEITGSNPKVSSKTDSKNTNSDNIGQTILNEISDTQNFDYTNVIKDKEIEENLTEAQNKSSGFQKSNTRLEVSELEVLLLEFIKADYQTYNSISLNENSLQPSRVFQTRDRNWNYEMIVFTGLNLTDASFRGAPAEVVASKNMTEKLGLGTQFGLDFSAVYKNRWSLTSGLKATVLHTIFKDVSDLQYVEDQHVVNGIILSQNNQILNEFSRDSSLTRNIYSADVHNNYYQTITFPVLVGWESRIGDVFYGLRLGPQVSYRFAQSGRTIDSEGIYRDFDNTEDIILKSWNIDLAGQLWLAIPVTRKLQIRGAYHVRATDNSVFNSSDINARVLNHQLRLGISFDL